MRNLGIQTLATFLVFSSLFSLPYYVQATNLSFSAGERLVYQARWLFVPAGQAELKVLPLRGAKAEKCYKFVLTSRTNSFVDVFYKVRQEIVSFAAADMYHSVLYTETGRGDEKKKVRVDFDWENNTAQYVNFGEKREPVSIKSGTFDPLAAFYAFRLKDLEPKKSVQIPITDGKEFFYSH